jgi:hypothetical protein
MLSFDVKISHRRRHVVFATMQQRQVGWTMMMNHHEQQER